MRPVSRCRARFAIALLLLATARAFALDPDRALTQLHHTAWTPKDGAPTQISAWVQTTDGYLWFGSARGLFRFDGISFELYKPSGGVTLPSHNIYDLLATPDGGLWISFRPSGLAFLEDGKLTVYRRAEELPRSPVNQFACDRDSRVWAATNDGLVLRQDARWIEIGAEWNLDQTRMRGLFVDREGALWVSSDDRLFVLRRGTRRFEPIERLPDYTPIIRQSRDGRIWVQQIQLGIRRLDGGPVLVGPQAVDFKFDRDGAMWIATSGEGLHRIRTPNGAIETYRASDGLSSDVVEGLLEDREGNMWVVTANGLDRFRHSHMVSVPLPAEYRRLTLAPAENGDVWVGSQAAATMLRVRADESVVETPMAEVGSMVRASEGTLWWGGRYGIWRMTRGRPQMFAFPDTLPRDWPWEIFRDDDGKSLWIGYGDVGLLRFRDGVFERRSHPAGIPDLVPSASFHDPLGRLWLGYNGNRVCVIERGAAQWLGAADGLEIGRIRVIRGRGPHVWLGGELGLAVCRNGHVHAVRGANGEPFGTVTGIVETADGAVWLNEMRGVVRIRAEEARLALADPKHAVAFDRFDLLDGLPGAPQMNWTVSTAVEASDGRLWFATDNGLARIDPGHLSLNPIPPPVSIVSLQGGEHQYGPTRRVTFPVGTRSLEIHYTALSLSIPERVAFRYKLEGVDDAWHDVGTRRVAFYTKLKPGRYRFRVLAANNDGLWNQEGASVEVELLPLFYQTTSFLVASLVSGAALLLLLNALRMRRLTARMQRLHDERLDERMRIAHELHDTLLQGVISASMQLHVADSRLPSASPAKGLVRDVIELLRRVAEDGRDALQGLRSNAADGPLEEALARVKEEVPLPAGTTFRVVVTGTSRPVHPIVGAEIHRIGREALLNAMRHSDAKAIEVEIEYLSTGMTMRIRDDGRGIEAEALESGSDGHWGLPGMRERADRIGARLRVFSRESAGTEIELTVPAAAYVARARRRGGSTAAD